MKKLTKLFVTLIIICFSAQAQQNITSQPDSTAESISIPEVTKAIMADIHEILLDSFRRAEQMDPSDPALWPSARFDFEGGQIIIQGWYRHQKNPFGNIHIYQRNPYFSINWTYSPEGKAISITEMRSSHDDDASTAFLKSIKQQLASNQYTIHLYK